MFSAPNPTVEYYKIKLLKEPFSKLMKPTEIRCVKGYAPKSNNKQIPNCTRKQYNYQTIC